MQRFGFHLFVSTIVCWTLYPILCAFTLLGVRANANKKSTLSSLSLGHSVPADWHCKLFALVVWKLWALGGHWGLGFAGGRCWDSWEYKKIIGKWDVIGKRSRMGQGLPLDCDANRMEVLSVLWIKDRCYPAKEFHYAIPLLKPVQRRTYLSYLCPLWSFIGWGSSRDLERAYALEDCEEVNTVS